MEALTPQIKALIITILAILAVVLLGYLNRVEFTATQLVSVIGIIASVATAIFGRRWLNQRRQKEGESQTELDGRG